MSSISNESELGEHFYPRGIGNEWTPGCFACGIPQEERTLHINIAAFVDSKESGEAIVNMFKAGAYLDYRSYEPNRIQVKVGVCEVHKQVIHNLYHMVSLNNNRISLDIIRLSIEAAAIEDQDIELEKSNA